MTELPFGGPQICQIAIGVITLKKETESELFRLHVWHTFLQLTYQKYLTINSFITFAHIYNVRLIDRKVLSSIYPAMNYLLFSFLLSQLCLIKVNHLFTLSYPYLFQI